MARILAIIPARGNSKGIPKKNIKLLGGKPLLAWTSEVAQTSGLFDKVVLSTDSQEIAEVGRKLGVEVPFLRPDDIATDAAPMLPAIQHALAHYAKEGYVPDRVFLLQPTSPFRRVETLLKSNDLLSRGWDSVVGLTRVPDGFSPYYLMKITDGNAEFFFPEGLRMARRQDAMAAYHRCGSVFAFTRDCLETYGDIYGKKCHPLLADEREGVNIDTQVDWDQAEAFLAADAKGRQ
jgi:CMP-N,N'-diacetyllegionaminic acid synthase